jgi:lipoate-protein ligase B
MTHFFVVLAPAPQAYRADLHWYLRALEEVVIRTLGRLGVEAGREEGLTGVWVEGRKVAVSECAVDARFAAVPEGGSEALHPPGYHALATGHWVGSSLS